MWEGSEIVELQGVCKVSHDYALDAHMVAGSTPFAEMRTLGKFFFLGGGLFFCRWWILNSLFSTGINHDI